MKRLKNYRFWLVLPIALCFIIVLAPLSIVEKIAEFISFIWEKKIWEWVEDND